MITFIEDLLYWKDNNKALEVPRRPMNISQDKELKVKHNRLQS